MGNRGVRRRLHVVTTLDWTVEPDSLSTYFSLSRFIVVSIHGNSYDLDSSGQLI